MTSSFLAPAQQGRNGWKQYLAGTLLLIFVPVFTCAILLALLFLILAIPYPYFRELLENKAGLEQFLYTRFYGFPFLLLIAFGAFSTLFLFILVLVLKKIHHREIYTLFGADFSGVRWQRVVQGFTIRFSLNIVRLVAIYILIPSRYKFSFNSSEWLLSLPFSFLLAVYLSLIFCLFFYGYLFQGLSGIVQKPIRLITIYGLILGTLLSLPLKDPITWMASVFFQIFLLWMILKDKRLEVIIGLMVADFFFFYSILRTISQKYQTPTILVRSTESLPPMINLVLAGIEVALFYYIYFHVTSQRQERSPE